MERFASDGPFENEAAHTYLQDNGAREMCVDASAVIVERKMLKVKQLSARIRTPQK